MREQRWESKDQVPFDEIPGLLSRLSTWGLKPVSHETDFICYIENFSVKHPCDFEPLLAWPVEDTTLVHIRKNWVGDFYLLAGAYRMVYQESPGQSTYCSISHPWRVQGQTSHHDPQQMLWTGFRERSHSFIRIRLNTREIITPGETHRDEERESWLAERMLIFGEAIDTMLLPIRMNISKNQLVLESTQPEALLLNSWPDAFGPCQFEYNASDPYEFLVPASRLAESCGREPVEIRSYLTGFSDSMLERFSRIPPEPRLAFRCSLHCRLEDLPQLQTLIGPDGRLYSTLCEFQTDQFLPENPTAYALIGVISQDDGPRIEIRLNRAPIPREELAQWLETLIGLPVLYSPLPAFP